MFALLLKTNGQKMKHIYQERLRNSLSSYIPINITKRASGCKLCLRILPPVPKITGKNYFRSKFIAVKMFTGWYSTPKFFLREISRLTRRHLCQSVEFAQLFQITRHSIHEIYQEAKAKTQQFFLTFRAKSSE